MNRSLCLCDLIPSINLKTKVSLIIHRRELKRTTNTGTLLTKSLINSEMRVRGEADRKALDLSDLLSPQYRSFLFYPADDALELNQDLVAADSLPIQLIVPDGNWRQASKVQSRHPELKDIPRVKISTKNPSQFHLRKEHFPEGMATLQAVAYALGVIEGPAVMETLLQLYQTKLERTLIGRGQLVNPVAKS